MSDKLPLSLFNCLDEAEARKARKRVEHEIKKAREEVLDEALQIIEYYCVCTGKNGILDRFEKLKKESLTAVRDTPQSGEGKNE